MSLEPRLAPGVEVSALIRRAEQEGGFATVLNKGDPERGSLLIVVTARGRHHAFLDRSLQPGGGYGWASCGPPAEDAERFAQYVARRRQSDPDCWIIELDIPQPERFIAETTALS